MYTFSRGEIIAIKGLPCTGKTEIATLLGKWANCQVLYIDDFLDAVSFEKGYTVESLPSKDEAERLHRLASDILFHVADYRLSFESIRLVIKSRLCSNFELDLLVELAAKNKYNVIIVECEMKNEWRWKHRLDYNVRGRIYRFGSSDRQWYKPRSWKDVEKARDEYDPQAWDLHLRLLINGPTFEDDDGDADADVDADADADAADDDDDNDDYNDDGNEGDGVGNDVGDGNDYGDGGDGGDNGSEGDDHRTPRVKRLMLNVIDDLELIPYSKYRITMLTSDFMDAIQYLIDSKEEEEEDSYMVVQFNKLRRFLLEKKLSASSSRGRSKYLCSTNASGSCVFKYLEAFQCANVDDEQNDQDKDDCHCGVCEDRVVLGQPAYTCYFCILTLHKSCAELDSENHFKGVIQTSKSLKDGTLDNLLYYSSHLMDFQDRRACRSCMETRNGFFFRCDACLFKTHLISRQLPTIISHDCHPEHFLSMRVGSTDFVCQACGACLSEFFHTKLLLARLRYGCYICKLDYHVHCALGPKEMKHKHGGYEHVMKLMYSHDGMEPEEDYWCEFCYRDLDPQVWFYYCKECPYVAHLHCALKDYFPVQMQNIEAY